MILRRAEICPGCGCRQLPATPTSAPIFANLGQNSELAGPVAGQMILLLVLNIFWNGLGNLAIGDKRGWAFGFLNWLVFALSMVTAGIPSLLFFAYCGYVGYQFLTEEHSSSAASSGLGIL